MRKFFSSLVRGMLYSSDYFCNADLCVMRRTFAFGTVGLLILGAILIFASAASNAEAIRTASESYLRSGGFDPEGLPVELQPSAPWYLLLFPLYWILLISFIAVVRYLAIAVFGELNRSFQRVFLIAGHSLIPMIIIGIVIGVFNQIFPIEPASAETAGVSALRVLVIGGAVMIGLAWEGLITVRAYVVTFEQYIGRAVLTAFAPWFSMGLLLLLSFFIG
jgi:hypothetical protein